MRHNANMWEAKNNLSDHNDVHKSLDTLISNRKRRIMREMDGQSVGRGFTVRVLAFMWEGKGESWLTKLY